MVTVSLIGLSGLILSSRLQSDHLSGHGRRRAGIRAIAIGADLLGIFPVAGAPPMMIFTLSRRPAAEMASMVVLIAGMVTVNSAEMCAPSSGGRRRRRPPS